MPYTLEHGSYYYRKTGSSDIQLMTDEVAMAVALHDGVFFLFKHGSPDQVKAWIAKAPSTMGPYMLVTFPSKFPPEEINRVIESSGAYLHHLSHDLLKTS